MKRILNNPKNLFLFIIVLIILIFFLIGYILGYIFTDKSCIESPFSYGLKKINQANQGRLNLTCSCFSFNRNYNGFSFNEEGIIE